MFRFGFELSHSVDQTSLDLVGINFLAIVFSVAVGNQLLDLGHHKVVEYLKLMVYFLGILSTMQYFNF
jgi:hypothetical protein